MATLSETAPVHQAPASARETIAAIVPAAGCGARTGLDRNKILAPLCGHPLLWWTLQALAASKAPLASVGVDLQKIVVAVRPEEFSAIRVLVSSLPIEVLLVAGGATRQESVGNAARAAQTNYILVHDAARPLASPELMVRVFEKALKCGAAIAAMPASDTVKLARNENGSASIANTLERSSIWLAQTPQVFRRELYLRAFAAAAAKGFAGTDCASLLERSGDAVALVLGEEGNFKVTYAADITRAEAALRERAV